MYILHFCLHPVAVGVHSEHVERIVVLAFYVPSLVLVGQLVPLISGEVGALREHKPLITEETYELVDTARRAYNHVQRLDLLARNDGEERVSVCVKSLILHIERSRTLSRFGCGDFLIAHLCAETVLAIVFYKVARHEVIAESATYVLRFARCVLHTVHHIERLRADGSLAVSGRHERHESGI